MRLCVLTCKKGFSALPIFLHKKRTLQVLSIFCRSFRTLKCKIYENVSNLKKRFDYIISFFRSFFYKNEHTVDFYTSEHLMFSIVRYKSTMEIGKNAFLLLDDCSN